MTSESELVKNLHAFLAEAHKRHGLTWRTQLGVFFATGGSQGATKTLRFDCYGSTEHCGFVQEEGASIDEAILKYKSGSDAKIVAAKLRAEAAQLEAIADDMLAAQRRCNREKL